MKLWRQRWSKWFGLGGVQVTLSRYVPDRGGFLSRDQVAQKTVMLILGFDLRKLKKFLYSFSVPPEMV